MGTFLRENWIWFVAPLVLVAVLITVVLVVGAGEDSPFLYNIW